MEKRTRVSYIQKQYYTSFIPLKTFNTLYQHVAKKKRQLFKYMHENCSQHYFPCFGLLTVCFHKKSQKS
jgi:hypothetical protein